MKRSALILFSIVLAFSVLETGLRLSGKYRTIQERTGQEFLSFYGGGFHSWYFHKEPETDFFNENTEYAYWHHYNDAGFRDTAMSACDSLYTIFLFGDSFIEGWGAPQDSTTPELLEGVLNADSTRYRVVNLGIGSSDVFFNLKNLEQLAQLYMPEAVIFSFNATDLEDYRRCGGQDRFLADGTTIFKSPTLRHRIYKKYHLARFYYESIRGFDYALLSPREYEKAYEIAVPAMADCMKKAYELCDQMDIHFIAVSYAIYREVCYAQLKGLMIDRFDGLFEIMPYVKVSKEFRPVADAPDCEDYGYFEDGHFNSRGYQALAENMYYAIKARYPEWFEIDSKK